MKSSAVAAGLARVIEGRAAVIIVLTLAFAIAAGWVCRDLRIDQELRRLLPPDYPSVLALDRAKQTLSHRSKLYVTIRSPSREANLGFGHALTPKLSDWAELNGAVFHRDFDFFERNALLYAPLADVLDLRRKVIARVREEVGRQAFGDFSANDEPGAARKALGVDPEALRSKYGGNAAAREYAEADEGRVMVVELSPTQPSTDVAFAKRIVQKTQTLVDELDPATFHPQMRVSMDGSYTQHAKRVEALRNEVISGSGAAVAALILTLIVYFRSVRAVLLIMVPLVLAVVGALAFAVLVFDGLNLVSAFIFAVLVGLGIDFGIHMLARIRHERERGHEPAQALTIALETTGRTTVVAGMSTLFAFASLSVADFRGFSQFGAVAAVGIGLALVAALVVMPALVVLTERVWPWRVASARDRRTKTGATVPRVHPVGLIAVVVAGVALAGFGLTSAPTLTFEHDLKALGVDRKKPKSSETSYRDAVGRAQTVAPAMALAATPAQGESIQRQLEALAEMTPQEVADFDPAHPPTRPLPWTVAEEGDPDEGAALDQEDDGDEFLDEFADNDLEDPKFVQLEALALSQSVMSPKTAKLLAGYERARLHDMDDRLHSMSSLHAFVPTLQAEKLEVIADIRRRIDDKRASLSTQTAAEVDKWYHYLQVGKPITVADLPEWIVARFADKAGDPADVVVVWTRGSKADEKNARRIYEAYRTLNTEDGEVELAADFFVIPEVFAAITQDGPQVMLLAALVMIVCGAVALRRLGGILAVTLTVGLAVLWLAAWMVAMGWKLNFFNVVALPLLIGMGQDDALHLYQRFREQRGGGLGAALRETGGAIFVTTLTTICGFGAMLFAGHRGLRSLAWVSVTGLIMAFVASVVVLPAILALSRPNR